MTSRRSSPIRPAGESSARVVLTATVREDEKPAILAGLAKAGGALAVRKIAKALAGGPPVVVRKGEVVEVLTDRRRSRLADQIRVELEAETAVRGVDRLDDSAARAEP